MKGSMPVIPAAALGALVGAMMPTKRAYARRRLRGRAMSTRTRRAALRYRPRGRRMSKRQWQAKARRSVAHPKNYSTSKTTESVLPDLTSSLLQRLRPTALITINRGNEINERQRDTVFISGIRLDLNFRNLEEDRVFINWAVVHPKQDQLIGQTQTDFFRDYTSSRTWDAGSAAKTGLSWSNAAINTDEYVILKRGKFLLIPNPTATVNQAVGYNSKDIQKELTCYVKIGRNFTFQDTPSTAPNDQIYFVCWGANPDQNAGNNVGVNGFTYRIRSIVYFREPKTA